MAKKLLNITILFTQYSNVRGIIIISKENFRIIIFNRISLIQHPNNNHLNYAYACLQASALRKLSHANVQGRESNLLEIKAVHERRNISKKLTWWGRVRRRVELRRPCGSFLFSFVLLVFPSSSSSPYSSSSSFSARGLTGSFFLPFVKETRWVRVSFTIRLCTTKRNAVKQKHAGVQARISIY